DFLDALDRIIKKAETADSHVAVIILGLANLSEIQALCTEKDVAWLFNDMSREIRNKALRATDFFHFRRDRQEFILVFADTEAGTAQTIIRRIHNLTKDCFCPGKKGKIYVTLKSGFAVFPDDANNPRDLIHCALQGMK
ncbi:MAG TPA: diguanylate cyclase, partial [bacterium]|nr:diguanylate cyclase [bacterium]